MLISLHKSCSAIDCVKITLYGQESSQVDSFIIYFNCPTSAFWLIGWLQELEKLSKKFDENVLDATKKFEKLITDKKDIEGLPATALGLAAQTAVSKVRHSSFHFVVSFFHFFSAHFIQESVWLFFFLSFFVISKGHKNATPEDGPWVITLDAPSFMAVMQHARNRALREEIYRAYVTRASSGDIDNTLIIDQILKLRLEKAKLLGYNNYAEVRVFETLYEIFLI